MKNIIVISQVVIAIILVVVILVQNKGTGLSGVFGGSGGVFRTKRGMEKHLNTATIILSIISIGISIANLLV
jgi:preprotein translocase subunit SecG